MKKHEIIIILSIFSMHYNFQTTQGVEEKDPIDLRIRHLKHKLLQDSYSSLEKDLGYYVDNSNQPITPISEHDKRKLEERWKQPELKSTTTEKYVASPENITETRIPLMIHHHNKHKKRPLQRMEKKPEAYEIFYRRMAFDVSKDRSRPQKWTHCLDLLSPFLNGYLNNISHTTKRVYSTDPNIRRLSYLLMLNMTEASTDEIRSTLYEISNLPIRIFQWDVSAVQTIITAIIRDGSYDFKGLKYGFKGLFKTWKLNTSNLTRLLSQSRVFRPPCIQINEHGGSTVSQKAIRYTKPDENQDNYKNTYATKNDDC